MNLRLIDMPVAARYLFWGMAQLVPYRDAVNSDPCSSDTKVYRVVFQESLQLESQYRCS